VSCSIFLIVLALIKFGFDPLTIGVTCLIGVGDRVYAHDLPTIAQAHVLQCLPLAASTSSARELCLGSLSQH
jgi:hypothetical protein